MDRTLRPRARAQIEMYCAFSLLTSRSARFAAFAKRLSANTLLSLSFSAKDLRSFHFVSIYKCDTAVLVKRTRYHQSRRESINSYKLAN